MPTLDAGYGGLQLHRCWVIAIAGLGKAGVASITPLAIAEGGSGAQPSVSLFQDAYAPLLSGVQISGQSTSPIKGDPRLGTLTIKIQLSDEYPEVRRFFMRRRAVSHVAELAAAFDVDDQTMTLATGHGTASGLAANDIIFIRRQAYRVTTVGPSSLLVTNSVPDGDGTYSAKTGLTPATDKGVEGHFGTRMTLLEVSDAGAEPPYEDPRVFDVPPFIEGREVTLYYSDGESIEQEQGNYVIRKVKTSDDGTMLEIQCDDLVGAQKDLKFNRDALRGEVQSATQADGRVRIVTTRARGSSDASLWSTTTAAVVQVGKSVLIVDAAPSVYLSGEGSPAIGLISAPAAAQLGSEPLPESDKLAQKPVYELLVSHLPETMAASGHPYYSSAGDIESGAAGVAEHPLDMLRMHLGTCDSLLPEHWRMWATVAIAKRYVDDAEIVRLRDNVYPGLRWTGVIAGKDGKEVDALDWMQATFLVGLGAGWAANTAGRITVRSLRSAGGYQRTTLTDTHIHRMGVAQELDPGSEVDTIKCLSAMTFDGTALVDLGTGSAYKQQFHVNRSASLQLDAPGLVAMSGDGAEQIEDYEVELTSLTELFRAAPQIVPVRLNAVEPVRPGEFRTLQRWGWSDPDTGDVAIADVVTLYGYVLRWAIDPKTHDQTITVLVMPFLDDGRIGATAELSAISHGTVSTLTTSSTTWIVDAPYQYRESSAGVFDELDTDNEQFVVGDIVVVVDGAGEVQTDAAVVTEVSGAATIKAADVATPGPIQAIGAAGNYTWQSGDHLVYASYAAATTAMKGVFAFFDYDRWKL